MFDPSLTLWLLEDAIETEMTLFSEDKEIISSGLGLPKKDIESIKVFKLMLSKIG